MAGFWEGFKPFGSVALTALFSVVTLFLLTKWMGPRQVSQMSIFDYINGITIGSIAADVALAKPGEMLPKFTAVVVYAGATMFISYLSDKSMTLRRFLCGRVTVLMRDGVMYDKNFKRTRMDINEFMMQCRSLGYFDPAQIHFALLEENGKVSVLPRAQDRPVTPADMEIVTDECDVVVNVIIDGKIMKENLKHLGFDELWLARQLEDQRIKRKDVFLATATAKGNLCVWRRGGAKKHTGME